MRPLIAVATNPFYSSYADVPLKDMKEESMDYFWLLSRLTEKICMSVRAAGGVPMLLTASNIEDEAASAAARANGFIFAGGEDTDPSYYEMDSMGTIAPNKSRDSFEFMLFRHAFKAHKPILGICRGCQLINIALGGTLHQNLPDVKEAWALHRRSDVMEGYVHDVEVLRPEFFPPHNGRLMKVNSMHHQAIDRLAPELCVTAATEDGLVEGVALPQDGHLVGVQWHPECLSASDAVNADIFAALVRAC